METRSKKRQKEISNCESNDAKKVNGTEPAIVCNKKKRNENNSSLKTLKTNDPMKRKEGEKSTVKKVGNNNISPLQ